MLQGTLVQYGQSQFVGIAGDVWMLRIAEGTWCVVHRTDDVTGKGQCGVMTGCYVGKCGHVVVPLGTIHTLGRHEVGVGALPSTRYGGTMEVNQQMMLGGTLQQVDTVSHIALTVA